MKTALLENIKRIHSITYGEKILSEQNFLNKITQGIDDPKKADLVVPDVDRFYQTIEDAANSGGLFEEKIGSMQYQKSVESMQIGLILLGYDLPKYGVDGLYGPETATAVDRFKKSNKIPSDNTNATPETLNLLIQQLKSKNVTPDMLKPHIDKVVSNFPKIGAGKTIMDFFIERGLTPEQSAGITGNLYQESGFNPNAVGDRGKAYGIAQWRDARLQTLKNRVQNWNTIDGQLKFLWYELNSTEKLALSKIKQTRTPQESAAVFAKYFERPATVNYDKREDLAQNIYLNYNQNTT